MNCAGGEGPALDPRLGVLAGTSFEAVLLVDDARRYAYVNAAAEDLLGAPADAILGRRLDDFTPSSHAELIDAYWATFERDRVAEGRGPLLREDGSQRIIEYRARWGFAPDRHLLVMRPMFTPGRRAAQSVQTRMLPLSPRELEVLQLAADGRSTQDIATILVISPATVKTHFQRIYEKLHARDRVAAVATALRLGLVS